MTRAAVAMLALAIGAACRPVPADRPVVAGVARPPAVVVETLNRGTAAPVLTGTVAFHSDREGRNRLFALDLASGVIRRLTTGSDYHDEQPAWSPDGRRLAFVTTAFDHATYDVAILDVADGTIARLTSHAAFDLHPAWSRDGRSVFFSSPRDGTQAVFRASRGGEDASRVSAPPERALMADASPDGQRIAYVQGSPEGLRIVAHDLRSGATTPIGPAGVDAADLRWSPDGRRLAFARVAHGATTLDLIDAAGGGWRSLGLTGFRLRHPTWSPDGQWIVVSAAADRSEDWDLVLVDIGQPARSFSLTSGRWEDRAPSWRPVE